MKSPLRNLIHRVLSNNIKSMTQFLFFFLIYFDFEKNSLTKLFNISITSAPFISTLENHLSAPFTHQGLLNHTQVHDTEHHDLRDLNITNKKQTKYLLP